MVESVFHYKNYRELIRGFAGNRGYKLKDLAEVAGCSHSYLSQVLTAQKAHLNKDQAYKIAREFHFREKETDFFLLLLDRETAGSTILVDYFEARLNDFYNNELKPENASDDMIATEEDVGYQYFSDFYHIAIHLATACTKFQTLESLKRRFKVEPETLEAKLAFLLEHGFIIKDKNKFYYQGMSVHLNKESPAYKNYHLNMRFHALCRDYKDSFNYSSLFALEEKDARELRSLLFDFVKEKKKVVTSSGSEDVFLLCLDFLKA